jgi:hypothetical protein
MASTTMAATSSGAMPPAVESLSAFLMNATSGGSSMPGSMSCSGRLRSERPMLVAMSDGTSTETPIFDPTERRSWARHSVRPTAANFDV